MSFLLLNVSPMIFTTRMVKNISWSAYGSSVSLLKGHLCNALPCEYINWHVLCISSGQRLVSTPCLTFSHRRVRQLCFISSSSSRNISCWWVRPALTGQQVWPFECIVITQCKTVFLRLRCSLNSWVMALCSPGPTRCSFTPLPCCIGCRGKRLFTSHPSLETPDVRHVSCRFLPSLGLFAIIFSRLRRSPTSSPICFYMASRLSINVGRFVMLVKALFTRDWRDNIVQCWIWW